MENQKSYLNHTARGLVELSPVLYFGTRDGVVGYGVGRRRSDEEEREEKERDGEANLRGGGGGR